jgi:hypothetical protein
MRAQAFVIVFGIPLGLLALALIQPGQLDDLPVLCLWRRLTGRPCFGCGTTHALSALMHGDLQDALHYNRIIAIVVPVGIWIWVAQLRVLWSGKGRPPEAAPTQTNTPKRGGA